MDVVFFVVVAVLLGVGLWRLLRWSHAQDIEAREHERIASRRERERLGRVFEAIVESLRKKDP